MAEDALEIVNNEAARRWEALIDRVVAGYSEYRLLPGRIIFTHTVVQPEFEGRGIASRLARTAVEDTIDHGLRITPRCPFVRAYLERHPELAGSVDFPVQRLAADDLGS